MKSKRGQEEMVGFVAIVVLIAVIGLVMLGLVLRQKPSASANPEVYQLLESAMEVTTNCSIEQETTRVRTLFEPCRKGANCLDGQDACQVLNKTLEDTLRNALYRGNESDIDYVLEARFIASSGISEPVLGLKQGNCSSEVIGALYPLPATLGRIDIKLDIC